MTTEKRQKARADIIDAAIACIATQGLDNATVRNIAAQAGVNTAAISYYFGGRDALIDAAMQETLKNAFDLDDIPRTPSDDYIAVLKATLSHWYDGIALYPGITKAHMDEVMKDRPGGAAFVEGFRTFIHALYALLLEHGLKDTPKNAAKLRTVFSAFLGSLLLPEVLALPLKKEDHIDLLVHILQA